MNDFKLIAIRPLTDCDKMYRKILTINTLYQFYQDYNFIFQDDDKTKDVIIIEYNCSAPESLYNIGDISINLSAIVGKNGSGKSSIIELIFASIYNISVKTGILNDIESKSGSIEKLEYLENLFIEIYYTLNENIYCLRLESNNKIIFKIFRYKTVITKTRYKLIETLEDEKVHLKELFYTIAINYSLYGLNSEQTGIWIKSLFHKNDGYQTPLVINPYREEGNIDINRELYLAKQRLLSNILKPIGKDKNDNYRFLTDTQKVESITFTLNKSKIDYAFWKGNNHEDDIISFEEFFKTDNKDFILNSVCDIFFYPGKRPSVNVKFKAEVELYVIKKLIKIARTYTDYKKYFHDNLIDHSGEPGSTKNKAISYPSHFDNLTGYLLLLKDDRSHVTFKLRQALNYLMNNILQENTTNGFHWEIKSDNDTGEVFEFLNILVEKLSKNIEKLKNVSKIIEFIPPSLFDVELHLITHDKSQSLFSELSSGEQQLIHTIQSIIYHANNVNSVFSRLANNEEKLKYKNVNIILDEVELYFHPEFQRKLVNQLINALFRMNLSEIKSFNILFSTHSPFILSDIPVSNILGLKDGKPENYAENEKTFGANIHDLLHNEFFMENGFMGEFAKSKINEVIDYMKLQVTNNEIIKLAGNTILSKVIKDRNKLIQQEILNLEQSHISKPFCEEIISIVGEPVLYYSLLELYSEAYPESKYVFIDKQIQKLNKLKNGRN